MKAAGALVLLVALLVGLSCLKSHRQLRRLTLITDQRGGGWYAGEQENVARRWSSANSILFQILNAPDPGSETFDDEFANRSPYRRHEEVDEGPEERSFSACLMWMDDNFQLPEWIAYHYHMMNLRYLVVHPDPRSKTSPSAVLDRWKDRMTIVEWSPANNFTTYETLTFANDSLARKVGLLVTRQVHFYQSCALYLQSQNRTWTSFHDVDEYIVVRAPTNHSRLFNSRAGQRGAIRAVVDTCSSNMTTNKSVHVNDDDSIHAQRSFWDYWFSHKPCVTIPRVLFGAVPSTDRDISLGVPSFVDARQFNTLNWRYHASLPGANDGLAKSIMDVSRIPPNTTVNLRVGSPHRPFQSMCPHAFPPRDSLPLVIHHYLGSWEAFSFRDDARRGGLRTIEKWQNRSSLRYGEANDDARPWIQGFVDHVGKEAAMDLLKGAGLPRGYTMTRNQTALWATMPPGS